MLCLEKDTYYVSSSPTGQKETLCVTQFEEAEMDTAPMCSGRIEKLDRVHGYPVWYIFIQKSNKT